MINEEWDRRFVAQARATGEKMCGGSLVNGTPERELDIWLLAYGSSARDINPEIAAKKSLSDWD